MLGKKRKNHESTALLEEICAGSYKTCKTTTKGDDDKEDENATQLTTSSFWSDTAISFHATTEFVA
jgi:hypothetical protein